MKDNQQKLAILISIDVLFVILSVFQANYCEISTNANDNLEIHDETEITSDKYKTKDSGYWYRDIPLYINDTSLLVFWIYISGISGTAISSVVIS